VGIVLKTVQTPRLLVLPRRWNLDLNSSISSAFIAFHCVTRGGGMGVPFGPRNKHQAAPNPGCSQRLNEPLHTPRMGQYCLLDPQILYPRYGCRTLPAVRPPVSLDFSLRPNPAVCETRKISGWGDALGLRPLGRFLGYRNSRCFGTCGVDLLCSCPEMGNKWSWCVIGSE